MRTVSLLGAVGCLVFAAAGCGGGSSVKGPSVPECRTRTAALHPADTLTVVVFDKIDLSHAPSPRNRAERFLFSHLYETLVTVDCRGVVQPGLAKSWKKASDGWYIELQEDARFWDDTPVTAADIVRSFQPAIQSGLAIGSVDIVDETHAIIHGTGGVPDLKLFAEPLLAIRKLSGPSGFPMGTGAWQPVTQGATAEEIRIRPASAQAPVVRFIKEDSGDAKDILNGSADAMITDDPAVIDYARTKPHVVVAPLAWDRAYVLVDPVRVEAVAAGRSVTDLPQTLLDALARDAVPVDARGGTHILSESWTAAPVSISTDRHVSHASSSSQVVFAADDPTARALAERIVALAATDTTSSAEARAVRSAMPGAAPGMRAAGMRADQFARRLYLDPPDANYVVSLSWNEDFPLLASTFHREAPWLANVQPLSRALIPLVETRSSFVAFSDRIGVIDGKNGDVRIMGPGVERAR